MKSATPATISRPMLRTVRHLPAYIDASRESFDFGLRAGVRINSSILRDYAAYPPGSPMTIQECVISMLAYAIDRDPDANRVAVIVGRNIDGRPVELTLVIARGQNTGFNQLFLDFADETEL